MTSKQFKIQVSEVRKSRKPRKSNKPRKQIVQEEPEMSPEQEFETQLWIVLTNPFMARIPQHDLLKVHLEWAIRDIIKGDYIR